MANENFTDDELQPEKPKVPATVNPFVRAVATNAAAETDQSRAIAETQAAMVIAKRFPRDPVAAMDRILNAFTRQSLAEKAQYVYTRGGSDVTGPSIRAAEAIAQGWGNIQFGVRELEQRGDESTVETFAWDVETNTRQIKVFQVKHVRYTRRGITRLEDPRDVYEMIANQGARRLRACILGVIPGDVVEAAMEQADVTLKTKAEVTPERLEHLLTLFAEQKVSKKAIEKRIQRRIEAMTPGQMIQLGKIFNSLRDGMSKASDWFAEEAEEETPRSGVAALEKRVKGKDAPQEPEAA